MNKIKFMTYLILLCLFSNNYAQQKMDDEVTLQVKDLLDLRLQILAAEMSSGSFKIIDMGRINIPVIISLEKDQKIIFEIEGNLQQNLPKETQNEIMMDNLEFVKVGITELIRKYFPKLNFEFDKYISGYWYLNLGGQPIAKWENGRFYRILK